MFTRHWELKVLFSSLQVPNPKPTEEYGIFCADFTPALKCSPLERTGIPAKGHLQGKELLHPWGNGALQCKELKELCSAEFSSPTLSCIWQQGEQLILGSLWTAGCAEKSWRVNSMQKGLPCKNCLWQHSQLLSHSAGWHSVCTPLSIFITQPLQRLELDFPRGNALE